MDVPECPHRPAMPSRLMPLSDSSDTKLCRSSRGVHSVGVRPGGLDDGSEGTQDVVPVESSSGCAGEDERVPARWALAFVLVGEDLSDAIFP